jgi:hypothetical protein
MICLAFCDVDLGFFGCDNIISLDKWVENGKNYERFVASSKRKFL